jgi:protein-disulfide isomerase
MHSLFRPLAAGAALAVMLAASPPVQAQSNFTDAQRGEIEKIVKDYLLRHPEVLQEVATEMEKKQAVADADKLKGVISSHKEEIFNSSRQVTLGNPQGDVTLVEFFDYNCGYCKRALSDTLDLLKTDPKLKVVLKEFPVLGPGSVEAAQVAIAVRMQDKTGKKYLDFHQKLLGNRGQADKARALAAAKDAGLDMARIDKDLQSPEVKASLEEAMKLAEALGVNGTPSYVVGQSMIPGAVGLAALKQQIQAARQGL